MTSKRYEVIYQDPPWAYSMCRSAGSAADQYATETEDQLLSWLPGKVNELAAPDCALFMWATWPQLVPAMALGAACNGFRYCTCPFVWIKSRKGFDPDQAKLFGMPDAVEMTTFPMGWHTAINTEFVLLFKKGNPGTFADKGMRQIHIEPIREHSRKPDAIRDMIMRAYPDTQRIELFARTATPGWAAWGNEIDKFTTPAA